MVGEWVLVRRAALDWLNGEHEDGFERLESARGNFWWRTEFRRRARLSTQPVPIETP